METIKIVLALTAQFELEEFQLYVKHAFLNDELNEVVYVQQSEGFMQR